MNVHNESNIYSNSDAKAAVTNAEKCKAYRERKKNQLNRARTGQWYHFLSTLNDEELKPCTVLELIHTRNALELPLTKRQLYDLINNERRRRSKTAKRQATVLSKEEGKEVSEHTLSKVQDNFAHTSDEQEKQNTQKRVKKQESKRQNQLCKIMKHISSKDLIESNSRKFIQNLSIHEQDESNVVNCGTVRDNDHQEPQLNQPIVIEDSKMIIDEVPKELMLVNTEQEFYQSRNSSSRQFAVQVISEPVLEAIEKSNTFEDSLIERIRKRIQKFGNALKHVDPEYNIDNGLKALESCIQKSKRVTADVHYNNDSSSNSSVVVVSSIFSFNKNPKEAIISQELSKSPQIANAIHSSSRKGQVIKTTEANTCSQTYKQLVKIYNAVEKVVNIRQCLREKLDLTKQRVTRGQDLLLKTTTADLGNAQIGYGELRVGSFNRILQNLQQISQKIEKLIGLQVHPGELMSYNLSKKSYFLDIGSGFGKPVFHTAFLIGCLAQGIEVVPARHQASLELLDAFSSLAEPNEDYWTKQVTFVQSNATEYESFKDTNGRHYTHIFSFNRVMGAKVNQGIVDVLNRSDFKVLVWTSNKEETLHKYGLKDAYLVETL